jgi:lia operon protein LiaF
VVGDESELAPRYDLAVCDLALDLSDLTLTESRTVRATVGAGEMRIHVPEDVAFEVDATVGAGDIDLLGETANGISVERRYTSGGFEEADVTLTLDLEVAAGEIEVTR